MPIDAAQVTIQQAANREISDLLDPVGSQTTSAQQVDLIPANLDERHIVYRGPAAYLTYVDVVLKLALATGDATLDVKLNAVSVGIITVVQIASAPGDRYTLDLGETVRVVSGDLLTITVGGGNTAAARADVSLALGSALEIG